MKALVYHKPGMIAWEERPQPAVKDPTDAVIKITATTICGTDLHILKGDVPEVPDGCILGHEGVGVVESVGSSVSTVKPGDKVLISCISSCGKCASCKKGMYSHCEGGGGWILGHLIDGTQAEYVRVPFADNSLYKAPPQVDDEALCMLSDIFPTGFECGVLNGEVKPGDTVAIVGAGPIGLAALLTAQFYSPAAVIMVDMDENRLQTARALGATHLVHAEADPVAEIMLLTGQKGVDVVMEAVGVPASFDICQKIVAAGGHIASIGVFGKSVNLEMQRLWSHNITLRTRLVDTVTTPMLLKNVQSGKLQPKQLITHRFKMADILKAYETFRNAAAGNVLKVIIAP